jgi:hypothetical protein
VLELALLLPLAARTDGPAVVDAEAEIVVPWMGISMEVGLEDDELLASEFWSASVITDAAHLADGKRDFG